MKQKGQVMTTWHKENHEYFTQYKPRIWNSESKLWLLHTVQSVSILHAIGQGYETQSPSYCYFTPCKAWVFYTLRAKAMKHRGQVMATSHSAKHEHFTRYRLRLLHTEAKLWLLHTVQSMSILHAIGKGYETQSPSYGYFTQCKAWVFYML